MLDILAWIGWSVGVIVLAAASGLALYGLRRRRVMHMERDAAERIKAFNDRRA